LRPVSRRFSPTATVSAMASAIVADSERKPAKSASATSNQTLANWASGNEDRALHQYGESLALARTIQDTTRQSADLHNIASVYATLGDQTRALDFYRQALDLFDITPNTRFRFASLEAMANIVRQQGRAGEALKMDREALSLAGTPPIRLRIAVHIARDLIELGRFKEAADTLETVLNPNGASDEVARAWALQERARLRASANDIAGAEADLEAAVATFKTYELTMDEFSAWVSRKSRVQIWVISIGLTTRAAGASERPQWRQCSSSLIEARAPMGHG